MDIKIRRAKLSDVSLIDKFQNEIGVHERDLDSNIKKNGKVRYQTLNDIKKLITSKNAIIVIAEFNNKPIGCGFGNIQKNSADWSRFKYKGYIGMMFVEKQYRSQGIGGIMLGYILDWFKKRKIKDIRLQVYQNNDIAVNAYKKAGFKNYIAEMTYRPN